MTTDRERLLALLDALDASPVQPCNVTWFALKAGQATGGIRGRADKAGNDAGTSSIQMATDT